MPRDIGRFVARYFQVLACGSIAAIVIDAIFFDSWNLDLSFLLMLWAAAYLIHHNPTARNWTIGVCGFVLVGLAIMIACAAIFGTENMTVTLGRRIEHPHFWQVALVGGIAALLAGLPFGLLLTPQARREFQQEVS